jgi:hypothetical protein
MNLIDKSIIYFREAFFDFTFKMQDKTYFATNLNSIGSLKIRSISYLSTVICPGESGTDRYGGETGQRCNDSYRRDPL